MPGQNIVAAELKRKKHSQQQPADAQEFEYDDIKYPNYGNYFDKGYDNYGDSADDD